MKVPLHSQRFLLPLKGVLLQCLDKNQNPINGAYASGFLMREADGLYLYTCWHVVTGYDPNDIKVGFDLPKRRYLQIALQDAQQRGEGIKAIGGVVTKTIPLYENDQPPFKQAWLQDDKHIAHKELNHVGLYVPFWHDAVKIRLPDDLCPSDIQIIGSEQIRPGGSELITPGEKCLIVGYPYGFSAFGQGQPTPMVLTRFVAAIRAYGSPIQLLLESAGSPGMSGAPVFVERDQELLLIGLYTGSIYPDAIQNGKEKTTTLGTVSVISLALWGHLPLVKEPSQRVASDTPTH